MGKPTGFMEYARQDPKKRPVAERVADYREVEQPLSPEELASPGRALHGLRHPVLPRLRVPAGEPHPRVQRHGLPQAVAAGPGPAARDEQLPGGHRPHLPRPVRGRLHASRSTRRPSRSGRSNWRSSSAAGARAGSGRSRRRGRPAAASPSSAPARPAWPPPSNSPARGTRSSSSRRPTGPAASCATASPTSNSKRPSSTAGWSR